MKTFVHLWEYHAEFLLEWKMFQTKGIEKNKNTFRVELLFLESRAVYEIMRKNMSEPDRPQMTIQYGAGTLHAGVLRLQTHTQNM
jgi:hypothetical protein